MVLKACCYCIDLRKGSLISAYLILIYVTVMLALQISIVVSIYSMGQGLDEDYKRDVYFNVFTLNIFIELIIILLQIILTVVLLVGLHKNKSGAVLTFIVLTAILLMLNMGIFIWTIYSFSSTYSAKEWCFNFLHFGMILGLHVYFLCVFGSYYNQMRKGQDGSTIGEKSQSYCV